MPSLIKSPPSDSSFWANLRDGRVEDEVPLEVGNTCKVIQDWQNPKGLVFKAGMAGKIIRKEDKWILVGFPGFEEAKQLPRSCLKGGGVPWGQWKLRGFDTGNRRLS
jgi:hypothetical protein